MDSLAKTLNDIQPLIIVGLYLLYYIVETLVPFFARREGRGRHLRRNLVMALMSFAVYGGLGLVALSIIGWTTRNHFGLLNWLDLPLAVAVPLTVVLMDFLSYCAHTLMHRVPVLWRFHRVHHSDARLDVTTSLRFHPFDIVINNTFQFLALVLVGPPMLGYAVYGVIILFVLFSQHADIAWPSWLDRGARILFSSPSFHKLHHSSVQDQTDSNYADLINLWDRAFGTYRNVPDLRTVRFGLVELDNEKGQTVGGMLKTPLFPI